MFQSICILKLQASDWRWYAAADEGVGFPNGDDWPIDKPEIALTHLSCGEFQEQANRTFENCTYLVF